MLLITLSYDGFQNIKLALSLMRDIFGHYIRVFSEKISPKPLVLIILTSYHIIMIMIMIIFALSLCTTHLMSHAQNICLVA